MGLAEQAPTLLVYIIGRWTPSMGTIGGLEGLDSFPLRLQPSVRF